MEQTLQHLEIEPAKSERRRRGRFPIEAHVRFTWLGVDGSWHSGTGTTRDISILGVFVLTHFVPTPGAAINLVVTTSSPAINSTALTLAGTGTVLRIDPPDGQPKGFAAEVDLSTSGTGFSFLSDSETTIH